MRKEPLNPIPWVLGSLALLIVCAGFFNSEYASFDYWRNIEYGTSRSEVVRNLGLLAVGVLGVIFAALRWINLNWQARTAERQADTANAQRALAERGLITDRFSRAVEHLVSAEILIRLGGIYTLWRLIDEISDHNERLRRQEVTAIVDMLAAFVRTNKNETVPEDNLEYHKWPDVRFFQPPVLQEDAFAVVNLLGKLDASYRAIAPDVQIDLSYADLRRGFFGKIDLSNMVVNYAKMSAGNFLESNFSNTQMLYADFTDSLLAGVNLKNADFGNSTLTGAFMEKSMCQGASFYKVNADGAFFDAADCQDVIFNEGSFSKTVFKDANCQNARFYRANFYEVIFNSAKCVNSNFARASFSGSSFFRADCQNANYSSARFYGISAGVDFSETNLKDVNFSDVIITGVAHFDGAVLSGANLSGANIENAVGLTQEQIDSAVCDQNNPPKLPDGLTPPTRGPEEK